MRISEIYYRKNLPHIQPVGFCFFVTANLHGAVPRSKVRLLKRDYLDRSQHIRQMKRGSERSAMLSKLQWRYFEDLDEVMDHIESGPKWLGNPQVAEVLAEQFYKYDGVYYNLIAYTIMNNHFHLLIDTRNQSLEDGSGEFIPLHKIMKRIKGASACYGNRILGRTGQFWRKESYDRYIRNEAMLNNITSYILENPVKAGLVAHWEDYPYNYLAIQR